MNLIILSSLSYDEGLYFRYVTMMAKEELSYDILLEAQKEDVDYYFKLLKRKGWFDFVDDFVEPEWRLEGVRIDTELNYPMTIRTDKIGCENALNLLGQMKSLRDIKYF